MSKAIVCMYTREDTYTHKLDGRKNAHDEVARVLWEEYALLPAFADWKQELFSLNRAVFSYAHMEFFKVSMSYSHKDKCAVYHVTPLRSWAEVGRAL